MTKNFILMKRNACATCCEVLFPFILMLLLAAVKALFTVTDTALTASDELYLQTNSSAYPSMMNLSQALAAGNPQSIMNLTFYGLPVKTGQLYYS
jgi:hypothetical protein